MTSSTTVDRPGTAHPRRLVGAYGGVCAAIGLAIGVVVGAGLAGRTQPAAIEDAALPGAAHAEPGLPISAPGNPYVNIHVPFRQAAQPGLPISAPGNPYVNLHVPFRQAAAQPAR